MALAPPPLRSASGLTPDEEAAIVEALGRPPAPVELRCFGVLWSEHCAYKHSREVLRRLPAGGPGVLQGPGENAGVVEIGSGWALVWKMESHNHPSAVDPYNGAATGVGGIIRDVLAMGARPIALLDSLRFGPLEDPRARRLLEGVVAGIAGYGNSVGVPTVGGELAVDAAYRDAPLVNVACLGLVRTDRIMRGRADPPGAVLLCAGARTGRDGVGGAAFASDLLDADAETDDRAAVQIGDPFAGKCLIEATLESLRTGLILGMQDMGAGGLACSAAEMVARAGRGVLLELDHVPLRERDMDPGEILLSESQERMLLVTAPEDAPRIAAVFSRWGLEAAVVGRVTDDGRFRAASGDRIVADLPVGLLTQALPRRVTARERAAPSAPIPRPVGDAAAALLRLVASPEVASKAGIYEQYDHMVQVRTVVRPGRGAAVLRLPEIAPAGLALTVDGNGHWCEADPYAGAVATVLEAAANLACVGAAPLAVTDCLNFGTPEDEEIFWTFERAVEGIAAACRALGVPVVGGNVSFYNGGPSGPIPPTPVVAMVGLVPEAAPSGQPGEGEALVLLGGSGRGDVAGDDPAEDPGDGTPGERVASAGLGGSLYADRILNVSGAFQHPDLDASRRTLACVREAVRRGLVSLAHDLSDGGLAVALAECCLLADLGARVTLSARARADASVLFGEGGSVRVLCALPQERLSGLRALARGHGVTLAVIGRLRGGTLRITMGDGEPLLDLPLADLRRAWTSLGGEREW